MKLGNVPDNLAERIALWTGILPPGVFESWFGIMFSRTIMVATRLNIFETLADGPLTAADVAARCDTHPHATEKLLNALVSLDCLRVRGERYELRKSLREWVLEDGKNSFRGQILLHFLEWRWWEHCEEYVRTCQTLKIHETMSDEDWGVSISAGCDRESRCQLNGSPERYRCAEVRGKCWISAAATAISPSPFAGGTRNFRQRFSICRKRSDMRHHCWTKKEWAIESNAWRETR